MTYANGHVTQFRYAVTTGLAVGTADSNGQTTSIAYTYDASGNLRRVTQGGQPRFFLYDSLSRLLRDKNSE